MSTSELIPRRSGVAGEPAVTTVAMMTSAWLKRYVIGRMMSEYLRRILLAQERGLIDTGAAAVAQVYHDNDCPHLSGGVCACDPEIIVRTDKGDTRILADGSLTSAAGKARE